MGRDLNTLAAAPNGGYRAAHLSPFDTVRNVSLGNALRQPGHRDEHGRGTDPVGKRQLLSGGSSGRLRGQSEELA